MSWVEQSHWDALRPEQRQAFPPIAPDFVLELLSPSDCDGAGQNAGIHGQWRTAGLAN